MAGPNVELTRQELYDHVWTTPLRTLAEKWGISGVWLAKLCERHEVPRPPQGHWAKKQYGKSAHRIPLPAIANHHLNEIKIVPVEQAAKSKITDPEIAELILRESAPGKAIKVDGRAKLRHPLVVAAKEFLKGESPDEYGRVSPKTRGAGKCCDVRVSPKNIHRALRIYQAFIMAMLARGHKLSESAPRDFCYFDVLGVTFTVTIREGSKRSNRKPDEPKPANAHFNQFVFTPTGILEFWVNYPGYYQSFALVETKEAPLENCLNEAIIRMLRIVDKSRTKVAEDAERRKVAEQREREWRAERRRIEQVQQLAGDWEAYQQVKTLIDAVREATASPGSEISAGTVAWLKWADAYLREIDPLCGGERLPSLADEP